MSDERLGPDLDNPQMGELVPSKVNCGERRMTEPMKIYVEGKENSATIAGWLKECAEDYEQSAANSDHSLLKAFRNGIEVCEVEIDSGDPLLGSEGDLFIKSTAKIGGEETS